MAPINDIKKSPTILNVNDNEHTRYLVTRVLKVAGFQVLEASSGEEALSLAEKGPDLIVLDVKLPDISGFEVCQKLKSNPITSQISIIHLSAHLVKASERIRGLDYGADAYLIQPVDSALLIPTIRTVLRTRAAEQELRNSVARLQEERELREKFVLMLSHDLRNPLTAAKTNAQIIQRHPEAWQRHLESAKKIERNIDRVDAMITDLLDVSRLRAGEVLPIEMSHCDLIPTIQESVDELIPVHGDRFQLDIPQSLHGYCSLDGIKRILENLITNGIKYGSADGDITVRLSADNSWAVLSVHNDGTPLTIQEQAAIFDQFRRTPSAQASQKKGWGLGLTLVRGITEAHQGKVRVESSADHGTTFFVELPLDARSVNTG